MKHNTEGRVSLSVHRAFVVQFGREADVGEGRVEGRVEHVTSGRVTRFHSLEELLSFVRQILREVNAQGEER